jgi:hypothetical protein
MRTLAVVSGDRGSSRSLNRPPGRRGACDDRCLWWWLRPGIGVRRRSWGASNRASGAMLSADLLELDADEPRHACAIGGELVLPAFRAVRCSPGDWAGSGRPGSAWSRSWRHESDNPRRRFPAANGSRRHPRRRPPLALTHREGPRSGVVAPRRKVRLSAGRSGVAPGWDDRGLAVVPQRNDWLSMNPPIAPADLGVRGGSGRCRQTNVRESHQLASLGT